MKTLLSILLGLMLLTSLMGFSYANPTVQPLQNTEGDNCNQQNQNNMMYNVTVACHGDSHVGGSADPPNGHCVVDSRTAPDSACACFSGRITPDLNCCPVGITPQSPEVSEIQPDPFCG